VKRALCFFKRALCFFKRALCFFKRALCFFKRAVCFFKRALCLCEMSAPAVATGERNVCLSHMCDMTDSHAVHYSIICNTSQKSPIFCEKSRIFCEMSGPCVVSHIAPGCMCPPFYQKIPVFCQKSPVFCQKSPVQPHLV